MEQQALSGIAGSNFGNSYLVEKKFEVMLDNASKKLMAEITKIKETIGSLQADVKELKAGYTNNSKMESQRQVMHIPSDNAESKGIRPGYDDINPKDVAVEKMFYFGNKR